MKTIFIAILVLCSNVSFASKSARHRHRVDAVHTPAQLSKYNLFASNNALIEQVWIVSDNEMRIVLKNANPLAEGDVAVFAYNYHKLTKAGDFASLLHVKPIFSQKGNVVIIKNAGLNLHNNYFVDIKGQQSQAFLDPSIGGILDTYFDASDEKNLGATLQKGVAQFKLWSPPAGRVRIVFFDSNNRPLRKSIEMKKGERGVWHARVSPRAVGVKSLDGLYYQYEVFAYGKSRLALDPYAKSMAAHSPLGTDKIGKAAIVDMQSDRATPQNFVRKYNNYKHIANDVDLVCYEVHVRDFTVQPGLVPTELAGTYKGFAKKTDYLKDLGITHVQLLPIQNFYTTNEVDRAFTDTDAPRSNYNWGYDPHNYFTPEGWFSSNAADPYSRIKEFRMLVQDLHSKNIGVIVDVVYNHTFLVETFENVAPGCYYRYNENHGISAHTGAGPTVESRRKMVQKLIVESLSHFVTEYHVDGFRFDLMGFMDHETMRLIRQEVGRTYNPNNVNELVLQGEAWVFSDIDTDAKATGLNAATTKLNHPKEYMNLGFFNDVARDAYAGREHLKGFVQGNYQEIDRSVTAILGGIKGFEMKGKSFSNEILNDDYNAFAESPAVCLNYLTIHDGFTLWDKINLSVDDASGLKRAKIMKLATAMLFTSQGKVILHGGDEMLRTKPLAKVDIETSRAHKTAYTNPEEGIEYFHENTYISNDYTNIFRWDRLTNAFSSIAVPMVDYYKGLIAMRRALPGLRMTDSENIKRGIKFYGMDQKEAPKVTAETLGLKDFADAKLQTLTLKFVNGPANETLYFAGEVYDKRRDANVADGNSYAVKFNANGIGEVRFSRQQIDNFDLGKWGDSKNLNFKLVKTPGTWQTIASAYSGSGNNRLRAADVDVNSAITVDLGVMDFASGAVAARDVDKFIAYEIDNTLETDVAAGVQASNYKTIVVVHNASEQAISIDIPSITNPDAWHVIADGQTAGIVPLVYSNAAQANKGETNVKIEYKKITVPALSTAVVVR